MHKKSENHGHKRVFTHNIDFYLPLLFILILFSITAAVLSQKPPGNPDSETPLYLSLENKIFAVDEQETQERADLLSGAVPPCSEYRALPDISEVSVKNHKTNEVFSLPLDEYTALALLAEMPVSFEAEALKAQAVASRTLAVNFILEGSRKDADICTDSRHFQGFLSYEEITARYGESGREAYEKAKNAALSTSGVVMLYDGLPIQAFFHASSPRSTVACEDVWGETLDYLVAVPAVETADNTEGYLREYSFDRHEFLTLLVKAGHRELSKYSQTALSEWVGQPRRNKSGTVSSILLGDEILTGIQFRNALALRSADFQISVAGDTVSITTQGYGHGVGMSQNGANLLAKQGYDFYEILRYYYSGISFGFV